MLIVATVVAVVSLPTARRDGSPVIPADIALVRLFRDGNFVKEVPPGGLTQVSIDDSVFGGTYSYTAAAVDLLGIEGERSAPVVAVVPFAQLAAPTIVSISVQ